MRLSLQRESCHFIEVYDEAVDNRASVLREEVAPLQDADFCVEVRRLEPIVQVVRAPVPIFFFEVTVADFFRVMSLQVVHVAILVGCVNVDQRRIILLLDEIAD